ncbi:MAG: DUF4157 domain-containing protein [Edaphobacter sp.]
MQAKPMPHMPGSQAPAIAGHTPVVQRFGGNESFQVDPARLGLASGGGRQLPDAVRGKMEAALGADFSAVRVHIGPQAERIGAIAFTTGSDIYFAPGRYQPESMQGQQLLGHELAHVVQQRQGRVRTSGNGGVAVVQDHALEAEADRLGHRAATQTQPLTSTLQPKVLMRVATPLGINQIGTPGQTAPVGTMGAHAAQRQVAGGARTLQTKGGNTLARLAQPRTFPGPEVEAQKAIVDKLETLVTTKLERHRFTGQFPGLLVLGGIELPANLEDNLIANARLTRIPNPAINADYFDLVKDDEELKSNIVRNTISTMAMAGQIEYLKKSGLIDKDWTVWVEIHYYRSREQATSNFHKDTLGQTLFVNLNYVTEHEIAGPEYVINPLAVATHDERVRGKGTVTGTLPPKFIANLDKARTNLGAPTKIKASTIPANGVVSFVDELIHHMTPLYGHRKVRAKDFGVFLQKKFPIDYAKAVAAYDQYQKTTYFWAVPASVASWLGSWVSSSVVDSRKWYAWIGMTKSNSKFDRTQLAASGLSPTLVNEVIDEHDENSEIGSGFRQVSIPISGKGPIRQPGTPPLKRQMSSKTLRGTLPQQVTGERRFFRTWVRAVPR